MKVVKGKRLITFMMAMVMLITAALQMSPISASAAMPMPRVQVALQSRVEEVKPGTTFVVDFEMEMLEGPGWGNAFFEIAYDPSLIRLIPYSQAAIGNLTMDVWAGRDMNAPWVQGGGNVDVNPSAMGPGTAMVGLVTSHGQNIPFDVSFSLRFEVLFSAPIGAEAVVTWNALGGGANLGTPGNPMIVPIYFQPAASNSFASVTIGQAPSTVMFNANGGEFVGFGTGNIFMTVQPGHTIGIDMPTNPVRTGYIFAGWQTAAGIPFTNVTQVNYDMVVYAQWVVEYIFVAFNPNEGLFPDVGTNWQTIQIQPGHSAGLNMPASPTRADFTFAGWNTEASGAGMWVDATTPIFESIALFAQWTAIVPNLWLNLESQVSQTQPGTQFIVDVDMTILEGPGWGNAFFDIQYDPTLVRLIPYSQVAMGYPWPDTLVNIWAGRDFTDPWVQNGGSVDINPGAKGPGTARIGIITSHGQNMPYDVSFRLRFEVLPSAPIGSETAVTWTAWGGATNLGVPGDPIIVPIYFAPPTPQSYAYITICCLPAITVMFNANGGSFFDTGSSWATANVQMGQSVGAANMPINPVLTGYVFTGWQTAAGEPFISTTPVYNDMIVFAQWTAAPPPTLPPQNLFINLESQTKQAKPGTQFVVDLEMLILDGPGWGNAFFDISYDPTLVRLIPYSQVTMGDTSVYIWVGRDFADQWVQFGGGVDVNPGAIGPGTARIGVISSHGQNIPFNVYFRLRFEVLPSAPHGEEVVITWNGLGGATNIGVPGNASIIPIYFAPSTPESYARLTVAERPVPMVTVTFNAAGGWFFGTGSEWKTVQMPLGSVIGAVMPEIPARVGYVFAGWNTTPCGSGMWLNAATPIYENINVYAIWQPGYVVVTFNPTGGSFEAGESGVRVIHSGSSLWFGNMVANPTRIGYVFTGWVTASGDWFDGSAPIYEDITLYARWTIGFLFAVFNPNGGTFADVGNNWRIVQVQPGNSIGHNMPYVPTREGYAFVGWNTSVDGFGMWLNSATPIFEHTTVHAQWMEMDLTVAFNPNGGSVDGSTDYWIIVNAQWGQPLGYENMPNVPTRMGFSFMGWNTEPNGMGMWLDETTPIFEIIAVHALWEPDLVEITFELNGGWFTDGDSGVRTLHRGEALWSANMPANPERPGHIFDGWKTAAGQWLDASTPIFEDITVFANWIEYDLFVAFNPNGGSVDGSMHYWINVDAQWGQPIGAANMPSVPTRTGFSFMGWNTEPNGMGMWLDETTPIFFNMAVHAIWAEDLVTVTFNPTGGVFDFGEYGQRWLPQGQSVGVANMPSNPISHSYAFAGWNTAADGSGHWFDGTTPIYANIVVYAQWIVHQIVVTFDPNGGTHVAGEPGWRWTNFGEALGSANMPSNPTRMFYSFAGWNTEASGLGMQFTSDTAIDSDIIVFAQWTAYPVVTFNPNGGTFPVGQTVSIIVPPGQPIGTANMPHTPALVGYMFAGWNTSPDGSGTWLDGNMIIFQNMTLYAIWTTGYVTVTFNPTGGAFSAAESGVRVINWGENMWTGHMPANPVRFGYIFTGWTTAYGEWFNGLNPIFEDITLYAQWMPEYFRVMFNPNGGSFPGFGNSWMMAHVQPGQPIGDANMPYLPTRTGFLFMGWNTFPDGSGMWVDGTTPIFYNKTVYAIWTVGYVIVTFDPAGGVFSFGESGVRTTYRGMSLWSAMPENPTRHGYTFAGWNTAADGSGMQFTSDSLIENDITVFAQWAAYFEVTFNPNGGMFPAGQTVSMIVHPGQPIGDANMPHLPALVGYMFMGWNTAPDGSGTWFDGTTPIFHNMTVYAIWTVGYVTVTFNPNGGVFSAGESGVRTTYRGMSLWSAMPENPTHHRYTFEGWNTSPDGLGTWFDSTTPVTADITLYAHWASFAVVTFNPTGGEFSPAENGVRLSPIGSALWTAMPETPTRHSYAFAGWNTLPDGSGTWFDSTTPIFENMTVYAIWSEDLITVTFNPNGGWFADGDNGIRTIYRGGTLWTMSIPFPPVHETHIFIGWGTADGILFNGSMPIYEDITLYAQWLTHYVTVTFNANGGSLEAGESGVRVINRGGNIWVGNLPANPVRVGYIFSGWVTEAGGWFDSLNPIFEDITLYAVWSASDIVTVTFNAAAGEFVDFGGTIRTVQGQPGQPIWHFNMPNDPVRAGYVFMGWRTEYGTQFTGSTPVLNDMTVYATWSQLLQFTVTFNANGGQFFDFDGTSRTVLVQPGQPVGFANMPINPLREGYLFAGWRTAGNVIFTGMTQVFSNTTVYAQWVPYQITVTFNPNGGMFPVGQNISIQVSPGQSLGTAMPASPVREGFAFTGWNTAIDGSGNWFGSATPVNTDTTVYAQWVSLVTVTFNPNSGAFVGGQNITITVPQGQPIGSLMPQIPTRPGHMFVGWVTAAGAPFTGETIVNANITVFAQWRPGVASVTITFNPNGGTIAPDSTSRTIRAGESLANNTTGAAMPAAPMLAGYMFMGWATVEGFPFNETTIITQDIEVFALFETIRNGWHQEGGHWFFYANGTRQLGWLDLGHALVYFIPELNGALATGLVVIDGVTHEFGPDGAWIRIVETRPDGWHQEGDHWFFYANGTRQIGWLDLGHALVYFIPELNGALATGLVVIDGVTHEFGPDGAWIREIRADGWHQIDGNWVLYSGGTRQMGWVDLGHALVYFIPELNGALATGFVVIDGATHEFGPDGAWIREVRADGWHQIDGNWVLYSGGTRQMGWVDLGHALVYFIPEQNGALATGLVVIDGVTHEFGPDGAWIRIVEATEDGWHQIDGNWVLYANGTRQMGWVDLGHALVYFIPELNGALATGTVIIDGVAHEFAPDGTWLA